jgi:hypothetical protein
MDDYGNQYFGGEENTACLIFDQWLISTTAYGFSCDKELANTQLYYLAVQVAL